RVLFRSSSVTLSSGGTGSSTINLSTTSAVATGSYTVTVVGTTGTVSKSVSIAVRVLPVGSDFSISNPIGGIIVVSQGWSTQPGITVSGIGGFSGSISLTTTISPPTSNVPTVTLSTYNVTLSVGGSSMTTATISTTSM